MGDPSTADFTTAASQLSADSAWHDLDISSVIGANAPAGLVLLHVSVSYGGTAKGFQAQCNRFIDNSYNGSKVEAQVSGVVLYADVWVEIAGGSKLRCLVDTSVTCTVTIGAFIPLAG